MLLEKQRVSELNGVPGRYKLCTSTSHLLVYSLIEAVISITM